MAMAVSRRIRSCCSMGLGMIFLLRCLVFTFGIHRALAWVQHPHHPQQKASSPPKAAQRTTTLHPWPIDPRKGRRGGATTTSSSFLTRFSCQRAASLVTRRTSHDDGHDTKPNILPTTITTTTTSRREWIQRLSVPAAAGAMTALGSNLLFPPQHSWAATTTTVQKVVDNNKNAPAPKVVISPAVCDPAVSVWQRQGRLVYLLGTAHISSTSAQTASDLVDQVQPKAVFVELDIKRVGGGATTVIGKRIQENQDAANFGTTASSSAAEVAHADAQDVMVPDSVKWVIPQPNLVSATSSSTSFQHVLVEDEELNDALSTQTTTTTTNNKKPNNNNPLNLRQRALQAGAAAVGNSIKTMYQRLDQSGFSAGEEFVNAIRQGQKIGAAIVLGDRDVEVTLRRLALALSQTDLGLLLSPDNDLEQSMRNLLPPESRTVVETGGGGGNVMGQLTDAEFKEEFSTYVETLRTKENVRMIMNQLKRVAPALYQVMLAERDVYMAGGLDTLGQFQTIVAVMGMAHVDGVERNLKDMGWKSVTLKCSGSRMTSTAIDPKRRK